MRVVHSGMLMRLPTIALSNGRRYRLCRSALPGPPVAPKRAARVLANDLLPWSSPPPPECRDAAVDATKPDTLARRLASASKNSSSPPPRESLRAYRGAEGVFKG